MISFCRSHGMKWQSRFRLWSRLTWIDIIAATDTLCHPQRVSSLPCKMSILSWGFGVGYSGALSTGPGRRLSGGAPSSASLIVFWSWHSVNGANQMSLSHPENAPLRLVSWSPLLSSSPSRR